MQLFYNPDLTSDLVQLTRDESVHAVKALRMRQGDTIFITDGRGTLAEGEIVAADTSACTVQILRRTYREHRAGYSLHLAVAPTKNADRIEWLVEKAVEIGIDEITPLITHNTERTRLNRERLEKIAISAMKQSLHTHLPIIHPETAYDAFIQHCGSTYVPNAQQQPDLSDPIVADNSESPGSQCPEALPAVPAVADLQSATPATPQSQPTVKLICHGHYAHPLTIAQACPPASHAVAVVGPEGDFTPDEIALADRCGFLPVTLGTSRLRTETAALTAVCAISTINQ